MYKCLPDYLSCGLADEGHRVSMGIGYRRGMYQLPFMAPKPVLYPHPTSGPTPNAVRSIHNGALLYIRVYSYVCVTPFATAYTVA